MKIAVKDLIFHKPVKRSSRNKTRKAAGQTFIANPELKHSAQEEWELLRNLYYQYDTDTLKKYGHQLQDMVLDCNFNGEDCRYCIVWYCIVLYCIVFM